MHKEQVIIPPRGDPQTNKTYKDNELLRALIDQLSHLLLLKKKKTVGSKHRE